MTRLAGVCTGHKWHAYPPDSKQESPRFSATLQQLARLYPAYVMQMRRHDGRRFRGDWGTVPLKFEVGGRSMYRPLHYLENTFCTLTKTRYGVLSMYFRQSTFQATK